MATQDKTNYWYELIERWISYDGVRHANVVASIPYDSLEHELFTISNPGVVHITGDGAVSLVAGSTVDIGVIAPGDNNIGDMDILTIASGETHIGQVGSESATIIANPTVTAGAYSIGDCVGGVLTFANAARAAGYGGVIKNLTLVDDAGQDGQMELWLFDQTFTAPGDNAAWAATEADLHNLVAIITSVDGAWFATGTPSVNVVEVSQQYTCVATSLFGQLVTRTSVTFAATDDISVKLGLLQD